MERWSTDSSGLKKRLSKESRRNTISSQPGEGWEGSYSWNLFEPTSGITELTEDNFDPYLQAKDVALVLFYDRYVTDTYVAKENIEKAAQITNRLNSGFASVNCKIQSALCEREGVDKFPSYKLYSQGHLVSAIQDHASFTSDVMKKYIDLSPIMENPLPARRLCERSEVDPHPKTKLANAQGVKPRWPKSESKRSSCCLPFGR